MISDDSLRSIFVGGALLLIALRAWRGWQLGVARQLVSLCALALAYPAAYFGGPLLVPFLRVFGFPDKLLAVIGGVILGGIVFVVVNLAGALLFKRTAQQSVGAVRVSYGLLGAFLGALFGVVLVWVAVMGVRVLGTLAETQVRVERGASGRAVAPRASSPRATNPLIRSLVEMKETLNQGTTGRVIDRVDPIPERVYTTLAKVGELVTREESITRFLEFPGVQPLAQHDKITALQRDPQIVREVTERDYLALLRNPRIVAAANDPEVADLLRGLDLEKALDYALRSPRTEELERR